MANNKRFDKGHITDFDKWQMSENDKWQVTDNDTLHIVESDYRWDYDFTNTQLMREKLNYLMELKTNIENIA